MNIGLVGLGGMGTVHYHNYEHIPEAKLVAVVGATDADRARAAEWNVPMYPSITDMCEHEPVQLVDICTPTFLHHDLVMESLRCGKHTITEKPVALTLADASEMFAAAEGEGVQLYVAQVLQFTKEVQALRAAVKDARYGKPLDACFERLSACPKWSAGGWLLDKRKSGLLPFDLHIHDLDVIVSLFGAPKDVRYTCCGPEDCRSQYRFTYGYDGLTVSAEAAWFNAAIPFTARWRVYFEHGMMICDANGLHGYDADGTVTEFDVAEDLLIPTGINLPPTGMFLRELRHFVECAEKGVPSPLVPKTQVLSVLKVLERL